MIKDCPIPESFRSMLWNILFITLLFFLTFISRFIFAPMMPAIVQDLSITQAQAGGVFLIGSLGVVLGSFSSGLVSSRLKHKWTLVLAVALAGLALVSIHFSASLSGIRVTMLILGLSAGMLMPSCVATITAIVSRQDWGKALAVQQLGPPLALVLGPLLLVLLPSGFTWTATLTVLGLFTMAVGICFALIAKIGRFPGDPPSLALLRFIFSQRSLWVFVALFALGVGCQVGIYAMLPLYMTAERGLAAGTANTIIGVAQVSALFMTFLAGWISDRIGEKRTIFIFLVLAGAATLLIGVSSGLWLKVMVFLQPAFIVCFFPPAFAALSRIVQPNLRSLASGFGPPIAFVLGGGLMPAFLGYMGEVYSLGLGISIFGGLIMLGAGLVVPLRLLDKLDDGC